MKKLLTYLLFISSITVYSQIDNDTFQVKMTIQKDSTLNGIIRTIEWHSEYLDEPRKISIFEPIGFRKDSVYDLIVTTDNQCKSIAKMLQDRIIKSTIKPVLIVGIHNRETQPIDTILKGYKVNFRSKEMIGRHGVESWTGKNYELRNDSVAVKLIQGRLEKYIKWVALEVVDFLRSQYILSDNDYWTLGGFSNGGAVVADICSSYPNVFGNIISMSPGGGGYDFDFSKTQSKFYICAGIIEWGFYKNSIELKKLLSKNNVCYTHKTFFAGHSYNMWLKFYEEILIEIYKK